jgi:predicted Rossmann fold flavoprotein
LKTERGKRVFPKSDSAFEIVDALKKFAGKSGAKMTHAAVEKLEIRNSKIAGLSAGGQKYDFDCVILCTGGVSYPKTGSTGDGHRLAKEAGHDIVKLKPSLVPLEIEEKFCADAMGLSLKNVILRVYDGEKEVFGEMGELLFSHFGISGPLALSASSHMREKNGGYKIKLDLKPALGEAQLDKRVLADFEKYKNKMFRNALDDLLPKKLVPVFVGILSDFINPGKKINEITTAERAKLVGLFKDFPMTFKAFRPMGEAIVTCGGVNTGEIHPGKMESKKLRGLFFAGEVLDVDAYTGGYNLQIAISTGRCAGQCASLCTAQAS